MDIVLLLDILVNGLIEAEGKFSDNPADFYSLEKAVKAATESFSAGFLGTVDTAASVLLIIEINTDISFSAASVLYTPVSLHPLYIPDPVPKVLGSLVLHTETVSCLHTASLQCQAVLQMTC